MEIFEKIIAVRFVEKALEKMVEEREPAKLNSSPQAAQDRYVANAARPNLPNSPSLFDDSFWGDPNRCSAQDIPGDAKICLDDSKNQVCSSKPLGMGIEAMVAQAVYENLMISIGDYFFPPICSAPSESPELNYSEKPEPICKKGDEF